MSAYRYIRSDAFTSGNSRGNPAASIYLEKDQDLTDVQMLDVAKQHKGFVSEVIFCKGLGSQCLDMAYFSSECEVNFCGHGTIACMYPLIKNDPELLMRPEINIHTRRKGDLTVYNRICEEDAVYISAPEPVHLEVPVSKKEVADILQIDMSAISERYPLDLIDAGNRTLIVPISGLSNEVSIFPDEQSLKRFSLENGIDVILIFCMDAENKNCFAHTRVFAAKFGYLEDPATGSGNAAFGYYMLKNRMWDGNKMILEQGGNDRIFNAVHLCVEKNRLLFGGSATTRIEGIYYI